MSTIDVKVPDIGDYKDVPVIEVLVKDGDAVEKDSILMVLESDKATLEVPSPAAGVVRGFKLKANDKVSQGDLICQLESAEAAKAAPAPAAAKPEPSKPAAPIVAPPPPKKAEVAAPATSSTVKVLVPDIGDYKGVPVIEVLVKDGDSVEKDAPLMVLESDKATMEVPSPAAGVVRNFKLKANDKVTQGDLVCELETVGAAAAAPDAAVAPASQAPASASTPAVVAPVTDLAPVPVPAAAKEGDVVYAGPATRKFARQLGVDLSKVGGSGPRGRIVIDDVQAFVKRTLSAPMAASAAVTSGIPPIPAVDFSKFGEIETKALSRIRKLSAAHLHRSWVNIPHVTQNDEADITEVEAFRKSAAEDGGVKLTMLPFIMKAISKAMEVYPEFNSSLAPDGENLILKKYCHIGFAADTENGLVVPVVRDVDKKGVAQLAKECSELAKKARDGKLKPDDMKGGCFSISSLGGIGGSHFTPVVNAPEVAILGASRAQMKPVWDGKAFQPRLMLPLSLSYDHRVIDGAYAARFIVLLVKLLSDVRRLAL